LRDAPTIPGAADNFPTESEKLEKKYLKKFQPGFFSGNLSRWGRVEPEKENPSSDSGKSREGFSLEGGCSLFER
jgi:hypothetical protein